MLLLPVESAFFARKRTLYRQQQRLVIMRRKPKDTLSDLMRAGALIAAEIDRLQRVAEAAMED